MHASLLRRDVFVSAPTRTRKSLTLELAQHAFDCLNGENSCNSSTVVLLHMVQLNSLMTYQVLNLNSGSILCLMYKILQNNLQLHDILVKKGVDRFLKSRTWKGNLIQQLKVTSLLIFCTKHNKNPSSQQLCGLLGHFAIFTMPLCGLKPCSWLHSLSYSTQKLVSLTCGFAKR